MKLAAILTLGLATLVCGTGAWLLLAPHKPRVRRIESENPVLIAAIKQAQAELPTFLAEVAKPKPGARYAFCARFATEQGPEYLWVRDPSTAPDGLDGWLDQDPLVRRDLHKGDSVHVKRADVVDFLIRDVTGQRRGGYTLKALGQ